MSPIKVMPLLLTGITPFVMVSGTARAAEPQIILAQAAQTPQQQEEERKKKLQQQQQHGRVSRNRSSRTTPRARSRSSNSMGKASSNRVSSRTTPRGLPQQPQHNAQGSNCSRGRQPQARVSQPHNAQGHNRQQPQQPHNAQGLCLAAA